MAKSSTDIAIGILRRDLVVIQVGDQEGEQGLTAQEAAESALAAGLYTEVFLLPVSNYMSAGMAHRPAVAAPLPSLSAPPLNLSPHADLKPESVVGMAEGTFVDEADGDSVAGNRAMRQIEGTRLSGEPGDKPQDQQPQTTTLASGVTVVTDPSGKVVAAAGLPGSGAIGESDGGNLAAPSVVQEVPPPADRPAKPQPPADKEVQAAVPSATAKPESKP